MECGPGVSFLVSALAAPVHSAGRRDHAFTSAIVSISTRQRRTKTTFLGICCACGAELFALGHSGVASFCCPCFFFGRGLQTAPFACFLSGVRDGWTARFSRYLAALPPLGAWNSTSQLWVYQLVVNFVGHSTEWTSERRWYRIGWLLDQAAIFASFKKAGAPVVLGPPKHRGWARYAHHRRAGVRFVVRSTCRGAKRHPAGGWRRTPTTGEAGTHPRREWPAPAPRAPPRPFLRRLRLKGDGSNRSWRRQTPGGLFVEQFVEQRMLNLDAT